MKKKIFFILNSNIFSGAEAVNINIIEELKDKYDFYWVSRKGSITKCLEERKIKWVEVEKISVKEIKRVVHQYQPDILHATDFKSSVICALANTHTHLIEHLHNNSPWLKKIGVNSIAFLYAGLKADKILTVSNAIENEYIFKKFLSSKIECMGNPICRSKILKNVEQDNVEKIYDICCVARITEAKNPLRFLSIIYEIKKTIPNIKAVWVGEGELRKQVQDKIKELGLENNIELVGFKENPYTYMQQAKIFLLASDWEGFGLVAYEALTLGVPCLVSKVGGLPDIVDDTCGKLCEKNEDFVENAIMLLKDEKTLLHYSENAVKRSNLIENYEKYMQRIVEIYESLSKRNVKEDEN